MQIFIRSSNKTHGLANGLHDYPEFLARWTKLLADHGAAAIGAERSPTTAELAKTDVLIDYSSDGANFTAGEKVLLNDYLKRGGGIVIIQRRYVRQ